MKILDSFHFILNPIPFKLISSKLLIPLLCLTVFGTACLTAQNTSLTNVALSKAARQSSEYREDIAGASKAVDGNTDGNFKFNSQNSVTHTQNERSAWWEVDLGAIYEIDHIVIWNREDCCWERLQNFLVTTSKTPFVRKGNVTQGDGMLKGPFSPWSANQRSFTIEVDENEPYKDARFIRITLRQGRTDRPLSLAEVQVFGKSASTPNTSPVIYNVPQLFPFGSEGQRKDSEVGAGKEINLEVIFVDFKGQFATSNDFDGLWRDITSNGYLFKAFQEHGVKVNVNLHKSGWKHMPQGVSYYFPTNTGNGDWKWQDYTQHSVKLLGQGADYPANTIAVIVPSRSVPGFKSGVPSGAHGANYRGIRKMVTLVPKVYEEHYTTLMHEIGHCFGSGELYPASPPYLHEVGGFDAMGDIVYATGFMGWHRFRYGWLDQERIQFLHKKGSFNVPLKKPSTSSGKAMVVLPDPSKPLKYWVIEIGQDLVTREQFKANKGEKLNAEGDRLIVYTVEHPEVLGKRAIRLVPRDKFFGEHGTTGWLDKVSYKSGQSFERNDMPFTFSVNNQTADGFSITINVKQDISYLTFPTDQVSSNGQYKLKFQSDGNLGIYRTSNNGYVWDAKNKLFAGQPSANTWVALRNGNIQLIDANNGGSLAEKSVGAPAGSQFKVSNDGKLLIVDSSGKEVWRNQ